MERRAWSATDTGRVRDHNEDSLLVSPELGLYVVCDGMGGHAAGEVASAMAAEAVEAGIRAQRALLERSLQGGREGRRAVKRMLTQVVQDACLKIFECGSTEEQQKGMGTTLSLLLLLGRRGYIAHVGDSRIYLLRDKQVHQLTEDHSLVNELLKRGHLTPSEIHELPIKNAVTRAVGIYESVEVDTLDFELLPDDRYLICSDGLHGYFEDGEALQLMGFESPNEIAPMCVELANGRGGKDNISIILVEMGPGDDRQSKRFHLGMAVLEGHPLFQHASYRELSLLLDVAEQRQVGAGELVATAGVDHALVILLNGQLEVRRGPAMLRTLIAGGYFGLRGLVADSNGRELCKAIRASTVMVFRRSDLQELARVELRLGAKIFWNLAHLISIGHEELQGLEGGPKVKLARLFLDQSGELEVPSSVVRPKSGPASQGGSRGLSQGPRSSRVSRPLSRPVSGPVPFGGKGLRRPPSMNQGAPRAKRLPGAEVAPGRREPEGSRGWNVMEAPEKRVGSYARRGSGEVTKVPRPRTPEGRRSRHQHLLAKRTQVTGEPQGMGDAKRKRHQLDDRSDTVREEVSREPTQRVKSPFRGED